MNPFPILRSAGTASVLALLLHPTVGFAQAAPPAPAAETPAPAESTDAAWSAETAPQATRGEVPVQKGAGDPFGPLLSRPGGLTSDQAAKRAAETSRDAEVRRAQIDVANAEIDQTVYGYFPRVTLTGRYTRQSEVPTTDFGGGGSLVATPNAPGPLPPGAPLVGIDTSSFSFTMPVNNYYLNANVTIPLSDYLLNLSKSLSASRAHRRAAELNERAARVLAASNARLTYYRWARERLAMAEAHQALQRARAQLDTIRKRYEAGQLARADVLRAEALVASSELNIRRASTGEAVAREQLNVLMHGGGDETIEWEIGENVLAADPKADEQKNLAELQREALQQRLEIRALDDTAYSLREASDAQRTFSLPRIEAFGNYTYANPNPRIFPQVEEWRATWDAGVQVVWTLNDIGTQGAQANVLDAQAREVEAQKRALEDSLRTEVVSAYRTLKEAELATSSAERGLAAAEASYNDRFLLFDNGRATSLDLLEAETALVQARLNLIDAHIALRTARVRLDHAVGRDVSDALPADQ